MNRQHSILAIAAVTAMLAASACDWRTFDDLADEAWVDSSGSPGNLNSDDYGVVVAYGGAPDPEGVFFVVAGLRPDGLAMLTYDGTGSRGTHGQMVSDGSTIPDPLPSQPAIAVDLSAPEGAVGVALSEDSDATGRVLVVTPEGPEMVASVAVGDSGVDALAFGRTNHPADADKTALVVTNDDILHIVTNYMGESAQRTEDSCRIAREAGLDILVANLDQGTAGSEIAVAIGNESQADAPSEVLIITGDMVQAASALEESCLSAGVREPLATLAAPASEPDFGNQLIVANFDGNATPDLVVNAPSNDTVYVYMNVNLDAGAPGTPLTVTGPGSTGFFGEAIAAGDFDGDGNDELVVGDSEVAVDGVRRAGQAYIYNFSGSAFGNPIELNDAQPEENQQFGRSVAVGVFGGTEQILCVTASDEVLTYFRTPVDGDADVRE